MKVVKSRVFTIYDVQIKAYMLPFLAISSGEAKRTFMDMANDERSKIHHHSDDFQLFEIASYDDATAKYENYVHPESHGIATTYKKVEVKVES